jgi:O-antigen/teichoic acid export membrane protein
VCAEISRVGRARRTAAGLPSRGAGPQPAASLSLRANFSWTLAGNLVYAGSQWGILVILAKLGTPEAVGQFVLGLAVTAPVMMLTNLQLRAVLATDARRAHRFADYLALRVTTTAVGFAIIGGIALSYRLDVCFVILAVAVAKAVESISDILNGLLQQRERMDLVGRALMLRGVLAAAAVAIVFCVSQSIVAAIVSMAVAWTVVLVFYEARRARRFWRTADGTASGSGPLLRPLGALFLMGLPLGFVAMLNSLNASIPRFFLESHWGEGELGIFAALSYVGVVATQVTSALAQSASPRLAHYYATGATDRFRRLLVQLVAVGAAIGTAGVLAAAIAGRPILALLYRAEYAEEVHVFVVLMAGAGLGCIAWHLGTAVVAMQQSARFPMPCVLLTLAAVLCSVLWIPTCGLRGAAWTSLFLAAGSCLIPLLILISRTVRASFEKT